MKNLFKQTDFITRIFTSIILIPIVLFVIWKGKIIFKIITIMASIIMIIEAIIMALKVIKISKKKGIILIISSILYIIFGSYCIIKIRELKYIGMKLSYWLFIIVWSTDIGSYIFGNITNGPKIPSIISEKKTWYGTILGCIFAILINIFITKIFKLVTNKYIFIGVIITIIAQCGDLLESFIKRKAKIKNSSNILPGHGGMLDRMDSLILAAIFLYIFFI